MGKITVILLLTAGLVFTFHLRTSALSQQRPQIRTQCIPELTARQQAENSPLPEYPTTEDEAHNLSGVVFATVLFNQEGLKSKVRIYETPGAAYSDAVKETLDRWKLKKLYDSTFQPKETRTGLRFHFIFENGKGRVEVATEQEQLEFGRDWGKKVCRSSFEE